MEWKYGIMLKACDVENGTVRKKKAEIEYLTDENGK